ncbi:MAG: hypothetical protein ACREU2_18570 [Steroidobacteraceae bacterium]
MVAKEGRKIGCQLPMRCKDFFDQAFQMLIRRQDAFPLGVELRAQCRNYRGMALGFQIGGRTRGSVPSNVSLAN